jgi:ATP/maltotriose-dependent transcriptional regulator MalT
MAKYYWPRRALPLLEEACRLAQAEQNWELEHMCQDGIGNVLMFLGRYDEAIAQHLCGIALARKTLNPLAEASTLNNLANVEMAKGSFDRSAAAMRESAKIDAHYPRWPLRLFRYHNRGILRLLTGEIGAARADLEFSLEEALNSDLWPIALLACAALGLCAVREGDFSALARRRQQVEQIAGARLHSLSDRWTVEAIFAWDTAVNGGDLPRAVATAERAARELKRRSIDQWLRLELEVIRLQEHVRGQWEEEQRGRLAEEARRYNARAIEREANARLEPPAGPLP